MAKVDTLKFDLEKMKGLQSKLTETSADLAEYKKTLMEALTNFKTEWNTPAGKDFIENVDLDWATQVDKYIGIVDAVESLISEAITQYSTVEESISTLKFENIEA